MVHYGIMFLTEKQYITPFPHRDTVLGKNLLHKNGIVFQVFQKPGKGIKAGMHTVLPAEAFNLTSTAIVLLFYFVCLIENTL